MKRHVRLIAILLAVAVLSGCKQTAGINQQPRDEAEQAAKDAAKNYQQARSFLTIEFASFPESNALAGIREGKRFFQSETEDLKTVEKQFEKASAKYLEAMNGKSESESDLHRRLFKLSQAYKKWAELAELDRQVCQEAVAIKDLKSFAARAKELDVRALHLSDEINQLIMSA
jgi:hypothetical protein